MDLSMGSSKSTRMRHVLESTMDTIAMIPLKKKTRMARSQPQHHHVQQADRWVTLLYLG